MNNLIARRASLAVGTALCALLTAPALALSTAEAMAETADEGEIVVTGSPIRDSLAASLKLQKKAPNIINAITADDAGRFPDQTVAAALARLPGIGVQRDQGQERYVQVRG